MVKRPRGEWILLPPETAPALIDRETFDAIQKQIAYNKQEALRNNHHKEELGLLRAGYIFCGVCSRRMAVMYAPKEGGNNEAKPLYRCYHKEGKELHVVHNHRTAIRVHNLDVVVKEKIREALLQPKVVREKVEAIRKANKPIVDEKEIAATIADIQQKMKNLLRLAENATDDETIVHLSQRMNELEKQKRETQALLYVLADDAEEREAIEKELQRFEKWVAGVQPSLTDPPMWRGQVTPSFVWR
jgi:NOL1/NOP2/fmu family ribosome biogenesis protein